MRAAKRRRLSILAAVLVFVIIAVIFLSSQAVTEPTPYFVEQLDARNRMQRCMDAILAYRAGLGIPLSDADIWHTGLIGEDYTAITTTIGAIEAKRTTADPDMAALLVRMFYEAGLKPGDSVGAGFSGSFPALNLAVICAADAMELRICYISSIGSSTHGANLPQLTFPDMAHRLYTDGLISADSALVTPGGDYDIGKGVFDESAFTPILSRVAAWPVPVMIQPDYQKNLNTRKAIYTQADIDCFVAVGGNITSMGKGDRAMALGQGVLRQDIFLNHTDDASGLVEWYLAQGLPVINLLNIRKIAADYAIPFDPLTRPPAGESPVYMAVRYPRGKIAAAFVFVFLVLLSFKLCVKAAAKTKARLMAVRTS